MSLITNDFGNRENPVMDYVRHSEIQGRYLVFFKAHGPVFYHVCHSPYIQVLRGCAFLCDVEVLPKDLFEFLQCISQQ